jgi:hypothetical protein
LAADRLLYVMVVGKNTPKLLTLIIINFYLTSVNQLRTAPKLLSLPTLD